jgi:drug/metabolite transporter (DMT)-like permease
MRMSYHPPTLKQTSVLITLAAMLWVPMTLVIIFFGERFTPRQLGGVGILNIILGTAILVWSFRTWIQKIK